MRRLLAREPPTRRPIDEPETDVAEAELVRTRDGRALHLERSGTGAPTVLFEAGMGASRHSWGGVVPLLTDRTTTVVYDRAGLGRSEPDPAGRPLARLTDDLLDVLDHLGPDPVVLVGHSWGGPIIRTAAAARPEQVLGLVLVDQTDEGCDLFFEPGNQRQTAWAGRILPLLARAGISRLITRRLSRALPEPAAQGLRDEDGTPAAMATQVAEVVGSVDDLRRLREHPPVLPDVPVTVISGTKVGVLERGRRPDLIAAHAARAAASPQGRHVRAERSAHLVPFTEPELVAAEVVRILDGVAR